MLAVYCLAAVALMTGITFVVFRAFGPPRPALLYTREEKNYWDGLINARLGQWFTRTNIFATLTSLSTVYVFFIGNTRLLGWWILTALPTLWIGALITNYFTRRIVSGTSFGALLATHEPSAAALPALFWSPEPRGRTMAELARRVLLAYLFGVLWLEFSVFADITGSLISDGNPVNSAALLFVVCFAIAFFTLRYGIRGFVFADLFQTPIIVIGSIVVLGAVSVALLVPGNGDAHITLGSLGYELSQPRLSTIECITFGIAGLFLNSFLVLVTPAHWLRLWVFGQAETKAQVPSIVATGSFWAVFVLIGALASASYTVARGFDEVGSGHEVVVHLLETMGTLSPFAVFSFWLAGMAALFSTADAQLYALLLLSAYDSRSNKLSPNANRGSAIVRAAGIATASALLYYVARRLELSIDKLVLVLLPACLTLVPAFVAMARRGGPRPTLTAISLALYLGCSLAGLATSNRAYLLTLGAPIAPLALALTVWVVTGTTRPAAGLSAATEGET